MQLFLKNIYFKINVINKYIIYYIIYIIIFIKFNKFSNKRCYKCKSNFNIETFGKYLEKYKKLMYYIIIFNI